MAEIDITVTDDEMSALEAARIAMGLGSLEEAAQALVRSRLARAFAPAGTDARRRPALYLVSNGSQPR